MRDMPTRDSAVARWKRLLPPFLLSFLTLFGVALFPASAAGQRVRSQVEEGNRLYEEGRFDEAHQKYLEALLEDPESPLIRFNDGNALYQSQDFQRAMERFQEALQSEDPAVQNPAWYNLGNALFRQQQLQESLEAYKRALRANPADIDAKHNLERVLEQLQEQEQEQQGEGDESQEEEQQDQNQQDQGAQNPQDQQDPEQGEEPPQEEEQAGQQPQQGEQPQEEEPQQEEGQPQPEPGGATTAVGEMTPEEAERLLDAIQEDPGDVNRRRAPATGRRPRKDW